MELSKVKNMILDIISKHAGKFPTQNWSVRYSNRQSRALASTRQWINSYIFGGRPYKIEFVFNSKYINANLNNVEAIKRTVLHEVAHAIVGASHNHDEVWVNCCKSIGGNSRRLARPNVDFIHW